MSEAIWMSIAIIVGALATAAYGYSMGLIRQVCSLAALFAGYVGACFAGERVASLLGLNQVVGEAIVFLIIYVAIMAVARVLHVTVKMILLNPVNKLLGGVFGIVQWLLIVSMVLNLFADELKPELVGAAPTQWTIQLLPRLLSYM